MTKFGPAELAEAIQRLSKAAEACKEELNIQDGRLGDGDLGITMTKGWAEAASVELPRDDLGKAFLQVSKAFQRVSSSSFGTLLATGLMAAARNTKGRAEADYADISSLVATALNAMMARGKGKLGQKSVLDVLDAVAAATSGKTEPSELATLARQAVIDALDRFRDRQAGLGRARMYGEASKGVDDPGMLAVQRMLDGLIGPES